MNKEENIGNLYLDATDGSESLNADFYEGIEEGKTYSKAEVLKALKAPLKFLQPAKGQYIARRYF